MLPFAFQEDDFCIFLQDLACELSQGGAEADPRVIKVVEGEDVDVKGQALEEEDGGQHARPLDLGQRLCRHVPLKVLLRVQPVALAVAGAPRPPSSLRCLDPAQHTLRFTPYVYPPTQIRPILGSAKEDCQLPLGWRLAHALYQIGKEAQTIVGFLAFSATSQ